MADQQDKLRKFHRTRISIFVVLIGGLVAFPAFKFLPVSYQWISAVFVLVFVMSLIVVIGVWYRCPYCNAIPRGRPIPYVDLLPKKCSSCGRSLRNR